MPTYVCIAAQGLLSAAKKGAIAIANYPNPWGGHGRAGLLRPGDLSGRDRGRSFHWWPANRLRPHDYFMLDDQRRSRTNKGGEIRLRQVAKPGDAGQVAKICNEVTYVGLVLPNPTYAGNSGLIDFHTAQCAALIAPYGLSGYLNSDHRSLLVFQQRAGR